VILRNAHGHGCDLVLATLLISLPPRCFPVNRFIGQCSHRYESRVLLRRLQMSSVHGEKWGCRTNIIYRYSGLDQEQTTDKP
jgi:hypothetical protein